MNPYSYTSAEPSYSLSLEKTHQSWLRHVLHFPSAYPTQYEENNTVRGEYFCPLGGDKAPLAILVHGMGDHSVIPCRLLARALVRRGIACFVLYTVLHSRRMPEAVRKRLPLLTPDEWFESYRISVIDVRQLVDWASSREEIDAEQVAVIGISFGGFISAITMGVDGRIGAGVFLTAGGNTHEIDQRGKFRTFRRHYGITEAESHDRYRRYVQYLAEVAEKGFENVPPAERNFLTDPLTFASNLKGRPVLMLNAYFDEYIPRKATLDFWEACGKPAITWFPATHTSFWLWYPLISRKVVHFLSSTFKV